MRNISSHSFVSNGLALGRLKLSSGKNTNNHVMEIEILKSKIHRVRVTGADLDYVGSITIDENWMHQAGLYEFEKVHVLNINNGERFETYVIKGRKGGHEIVLNGAAARKVQTGDLVIILAYTRIDSKDVENHHPRIVMADELV